MGPSCMCGIENTESGPSCMCEIENTESGT